MQISNLYVNPRAHILQRPLNTNKEMWKRVCKYILLPSPCLVTTKTYLSFFITFSVKSNI